MPAIDGLRALAVAGVVMFHLPAMQMVGGYLGVDLFLVISGYLITALLLAEVAATGRIGLGTFWMRRLRRLVPALALMLAGTVTWMALADWTLVHRARTMLLASLGYVTNWYQAAVPYLPWDPASRPGIYEHLWSLAVEEQFYLVWPLVLAALLVVVGIRRRTLMAGVVAGALASAALAWVLFDAGVDTARIYYGTDTRVVALLVGIALAVALPPARFTAWRPSGVAGTLLDIAGPVALVAVVGMFMAFSQVGGALFHGGFLLIALVAAVLLIAAVHPSTPTARLFSLAPLVWIGARSYGIYLWHLPVITLFTPDLGAPVDGAWLAALPDAEETIVMQESGVDAETAGKLVKIAAKVRNLRTHGLEEGVSTRLLVYAGQLITGGVEPTVACEATICRPITDDLEMQRSILELVNTQF